MKADIKLCTGSFSVVTLPVSFHAWSRSSSFPHWRGWDLSWQTVLLLWNISTGMTCVWGSETLHDVTEHDCDSLKVNVLCTLIKNTVTS